MKNFKADPNNFWEILKKILQGEKINPTTFLLKSFFFGWSQKFFYFNPIIYKIKKIAFAYYF